MKVQILKCQCGNEYEFETRTELEYSDGSDEPNTSNNLIEVTINECLICGEIIITQPLQ